MDASNNCIKVFMLYAVPEKKEQNDFYRNSNKTEYFKDKIIIFLRKLYHI